ncbi:hypothetical protein GCM10010522_31740 [Kribbella solani]
MYLGGQGCKAGEAQEATGSLGGAGWSVRQAIELVDAAIDVVGGQLARSAGLWAGSSSPFDEREPTVVRRRRASSISAKELLEQQEVGRDIGLM